jgi:hypothetical protein
MSVWIVSQLSGMARLTYEDEQAKIDEEEPMLALKLLAPETTR